MLQVSYVSQTTEPMSSRDLLNLLLECREKNKRRGVTGMLLYGNGTFLQAIEGDDDVIDELVAKITDDSRHDKIQMLHRRPIEAREYAEWSMGFEFVAEEDLRDVEGLTNFVPDDFTFEYLAGHEGIVDKLLEHYREPHWHQVIGELDAKERVIQHLERSLNTMRDQVRIAQLALESVTEAAHNGEPGEAVLRICETTLASMRGSPTGAKEHAD
jgi:hypothetical protein